MQDKRHRNQSDMFRNKSGSMKTACEIIGKNRLLIENHYGILGYSMCCIHVRTEYGSIQILGNNLCFDFMSRTRLLIKGDITDMKLIGRGL